MLACNVIVNICYLHISWHRFGRLAHFAARMLRCRFTSCCLKGHVIRIVLGQRSDKNTLLDISDLTRAENTPSVMLKLN